MPEPSSQATATESPLTATVGWVCTLDWGLAEMMIGGRVLGGGAVS